MGEIVIYSPNKMEGQVISSLLKRRNIESKIIQTFDDLLKIVRLGDPSMILFNLASISKINKDLEDILTIAQGIPIIMAIPYGDNEEESKLFQKRGYHILEKPISIEKLMELLLLS